MNAMGHGVPTLIGVDHRGLAGPLQRAVPEMMVMGERGMHDMTEMSMPLPDNTAPMMAGQGPFGAIGMGGMFSVLKVREQLPKGWVPGQGHRLVRTPGGHAGARMDRSRAGGQGSGDAGQGRARSAGAQATASQPLRNTTMKRRILLPLLALPLLARAHGEGKHAKQQAAAAQQTDWGIAGDPRRISRTVEIAMDDTMRFTPDRLEVREGETLRLRVRNRGKMLHELVIGTPAELAKHAELMQKFPNMEHDEPWMAHVDAGKRGELVWHFNRAGGFQFACLIAGHFQAGMLGHITVRKAQ